MDARRQLAVLLLACSLLTASICAPPTRSRRQKRGLMKMMMHIVWDPVRLIRYWHVYDVSKEIAKSWRKILPTIMLLPVTNSNPRSYPGIAKYVHPTNGFRDSKKSASSYLKSSAGSVRPVVLPPQALHPALFPHYALASDMIRHHYAISNHHTEGHQGVKYDLQGASAPVVVGHVPYGDGDGQRTVAHYYMKGGNLLGQETSSYLNENGVHHHHHSNSIDVIRAASSQRLPHRAKERPGYVLPSTKHIHYVPHAESEGPIVHDDSEKDRSPLMVLQPGQEFQVVLHPIPVGEFDPDALKPPPDGHHEYQYAPVRSLDSHDSVSPILFKAVAADTEEDENDRYLRNHRHPVDGGHEIDRSESAAGGKSSSYKEGHTGTWAMPKKSSRKMTGKNSGDDPDLNADGSVKKVLSIRKFSNLKEEAKNSSEGSSSKVRKTFGLHRFNINMDQLREDLKHGTPVLIPFNKNAHSSNAQTSVADNESKPRTTQTSTTTTVLPVTDHAETEKELLADHPNNQRLLLFLKKKKS